jgi:hypothetical protein
LEIRSIFNVKQVSTVTNAYALRPIGNERGLYDTTLVSRRCGFNFTRDFTKQLVVSTIVFTIET